MTNLEVLYEDNHIIVVNKKANVLSQSDNTKDIDMLTLVKEYIKEKYNKPGNVYVGLVHRLDRPVSGLMIFAKTSKSAARLSKMIAEHDFEKKYLAVVTGTIKENDILIDYLGKDDNQSAYITDEQNGKKAILEYKKLETIDNLNLVEVNLKTGRHHQIRIQFASRGNYLYGDQRYGIQDKKQIALHAYKIKFIHPVTKVELEFTKYPDKIGIWDKFKYLKEV